MALFKGLAAPRPADWGLRVSVCIALMCNDSKAIVTVSDAKVTFGGYSADRVAVKNVPMHKNCAVMFAGDDVEHAAPILERTWELTLASIKKQSKDERPSPAEIADMVDQAYSERLQREIAAKVLRKRGFDVDSFRDKGKLKCTPSAYLSLCSRIDQVNISLEFLVCGFDKEGKAHIIRVDGKSAPKSYDPIGMWAIGSGAYSAMSWLAFHADRRHVSRYESLETAAYFALTAKFMSEASGDVGKETFTIILEPDKQTKYVSYAGANSIRAFWEDQGMPPLPAGIKEEVGQVISTMTHDVEESDKAEQPK
jgi:20S proteasome alpha/beta subunit